MFLSLATTHQSFGQSPLGAFIESPLKGRGPAGATMCVAPGGHVAGGGWSSDTDSYALDTWTARSDLLSGRASVGAFSLGTTGYLCGGSPSSSRATHAYVVDNWTTMADLPLPARLDNAASSVNGAAYTFGGNWWYLRDTDEYVPDAWASKTDLPVPGRHSAAATRIEGSAYLFGGREDIVPSPGYRDIRDTDEYTPDSWTSKTDLPFPGRIDHGAFTIAGSAYVCSGWRTEPDSPYSTDFRADVDEYTPDTWVSKTDVPSPLRAYVGSATLNGRGYIYGGYYSGYLADTDEYTPDTWTSRADVPAPARGDFGGGFAI